MTSHELSQRVPRAVPFLLNSTLFTGLYRITYSISLFFTKLWPPKYGCDCPCSFWNNIMVLLWQKPGYVDAAGRIFYVPIRFDGVEWFYHYMMYWYGVMPPIPSEYQWMCIGAVLFCPLYASKNRPLAPFIEPSSIDVLAIRFHYHDDYCRTV